jgi:hypothetical protein
MLIRNERGCWRLFYSVRLSFRFVFKNISAPKLQVYTYISSNIFSHHLDLCPAFCDLCECR